MKKIFFIVISLAALAGIFRVGNEIYIRRTGTKIALLYTSDIHGHILPEKHYSEGPSQYFTTGGFGSLETYLKGLTGNFLLLDNGDIFTGTAEGTLAEGKLMIDIMNRLNYRGVGVGNHELDFGADFLSNAAKMANFPFITSNLFMKDGSVKETVPYVIYDVGGVKILVLSLIEEDLDKVLSKETASAFRVEDPVETVKKYADELAGRWDVLVVLSGLGCDEDIRIAKETGIIDVILGGETHKEMEKPVFEGKTMIVNPGWALMNVGRVDLWVKGTVKKKKWKLIQLAENVYPPTNIVEEILPLYETGEYRNLKNPVGRSGNWILRYGKYPSTPLGNFITDAMREKTGASFAFQNIYGIRADIPPGVVTMRDLKSVCPFGNTVVLMKLTGAEIRELLAQSATMEKGLLQLSGLKMYFNSSLPPDKRLLNVIVGDEEIKEDEEFLVATNSFLAGGGDGFVTFTKGREIKDTNLTLLEILAEYFSKNSPVSVEEEERIVDVAR